MANYEHANGCFPPAYLPDENGNPKHSWRVLLLPWLELESLYKKYDFSEPWNGPNNRKLRAEMPDVYGCPHDPARQKFKTSYVVIVGNETVFNGGQSLSRSQITDGPATTILVVEVAESNIDWMEPRDFKFGEMRFSINDGLGMSPSSRRHPPYILSADFHVRAIDTDNPDTLRALITANAQEPIPEDW